jgi:hypothetical protein
MAGKQCGVLPSYTVDSHLKCVKFIECSMTGRANDPKCVAKGQK